MSVSRIAKMVGVSPSTVSRVLTNPEYRCAVPGLRDRIWNAAMEIDYTPNEAARSLKKGVYDQKRQVFRIRIILTRSEKHHVDPFFTELLRIVESEIHKASCILSQVWYMSFFSDDRQCAITDLDRVVEELYNETGAETDGIIVVGRCNPEALRKLRKRFRNVVSINRNPISSEVDEVTCDGAKIAAMAVEHLISLGHTEEEPTRRYIAHNTVNTA